MADVSLRVRPGAKAASSWQRGATGWTVVLMCEGRRMTVPFFMGSGHEGRPPTLRDVLDCLLADASMVDGLSGPEWARECGFSVEDAWEPVYRKVVRQTERVKRLLGEHFNTYVEV